LIAQGASLRHDLILNGKIALPFGIRLSLGLRVLLHDEVAVGFSHCAFFEEPTFVFVALACGDSLRLGQLCFRELALFFSQVLILEHLLDLELTLARGSAVGFQLPVNLPLAFANQVFALLCNDVELVLAILLGNAPVHLLDLTAVPVFFLLPPLCVCSQRHLLLLELTLLVKLALLHLHLCFSAVVCADSTNSASCKTESC
jgi:hypothetical protein